MIGKKIEYSDTDKKYDGTIQTGKILDKVRIDNTDFYLTYNQEHGKVDLVKPNSILYLISN